MAEAPPAVVSFHGRLGRLWGKRRWERLYGRVPSKHNPNVADMCACMETDIECKRHPEIADWEGNHG